MKFFYFALIAIFGVASGVSSSTASSRSADSGHQSNWKSIISDFLLALNASQSGGIDGAPSKGLGNSLGSSIFGSDSAGLGDTRLLGLFDVLLSELGLSSSGSSSGDSAKSQQSG